MNQFFINITKKLDLELYKNSTLADVDSITFKKIRKYFPDISYGNFDFTGVSLEDLKKEILNLNIKKYSTNGSSPKAKR